MALRYALVSFFATRMRQGTVFGARRLAFVILFHILFSALIASLYYCLLHQPMDPDIIAGIKDYIDLCVSGIIFLLGGFVTTTLGRWWFIRLNAIGGLCQSLASVSLITTSVFSTASACDKEARLLVARYALLVFALLFAEAQEHSNDDAGLGMDKRLAALQTGGLLLPAELEALRGVPGKAVMALTWLASFWETAFNPKSGKAVSAAIAARNCDNGRYSSVYGQLFNARQHIVETDAYLNTPLPYGYMHLILIVVHVTSLATSIYCGINMGVTLHDECNVHAPAGDWVPFIIVRVMRIVFIPVLLKGLLVVCDVISNPMGDDEDDLPAGALLEHMEDEILAGIRAVEVAHPAALLLDAAEVKGA